MNEPDSWKSGDVARARRVLDVALVASFVVGLALPLAGLNRPGAERSIEEIERRPATQFPQFEFRGQGLLVRPRALSIRLFPSRFEAWFNDHLGGRRQFIRLYNLAKVCGLTSGNLNGVAAGKRAQSRVVVGRDGWLFWGDFDQMDDARCLRPFSVEQLEHWRNTLEARRDWLARRGIRYLVYIVPSQQTVYSEFLPRSLTRVGTQSRLDQLLAALDHSGGITVLDGRARLTAAKSQWPTYHKTDNHWNEFGAFIGYQQICEQLSDWFPQLRLRRLSDFEVRVADAPGGSLAQIADSPLPFRERLVTLSPREPRHARFESMPESAGHTLHSFTARPDGELTRAVFLHDSFYEALWPFLGEHFQRIRCVWTHDFPLDVIEAERPCVVIQELVEWKLLEYEPKNPASMGVTQDPNNLARRHNENQR